jgi:diguanylate cyclase (GGDEF)-like protein
VDQVVRPPGTTGPRAGAHRPARTGRRIVGWALVAELVIGAAALTMLAPLLAARSDLRAVENADATVSTQLAALRTTVFEWQSFIEHQLDALKPGVAPNPEEVVKGGQLATSQNAQAAVLSRSLRRVGLGSDAGRLDARMRAFSDSITALTPVASGKTADAVTVRTLVATERAAADGLWSLTTEIGRNVQSTVVARQTRHAREHLAAVELLFLALTVGASVVLAITAALVGRRSSRRAHEQVETTRRHEYETRVQEALEMTKTETDVYAIVGEALHESVAKLKVELLIADSSRAHFRRALTNGEDFEGCGVLSPLDCPAATVGHILTFPSSRELNACPYLKGRPSGDCSAACVPISIAGRSVGVTHAVGRDGSPPSERDLQALNFTVRRASERVAMIRAFATAETQAHTDPLTGLLNRRSLEDAVRGLTDDGIAYALAYGDLDHFKVLNDTHGHDAGDRALRLFARVLRDAIRPNDVAGRYGGEEFVIVLPDCSLETATGVLERVRERLALALTAGQVPSFTVSFGVAASADARAFNGVVELADSALLSAKNAGRNRVVVAPSSLEPEPSRSGQPADA